MTGGEGQEAVCPRLRLLPSPDRLFPIRRQVRAMRLSFVGEMGWELHVPREHCLKVYRAVMEAGAKHGIANAGYRAIDSLSIEKGLGETFRIAPPMRVPVHAKSSGAQALRGVQADEEDCLPSPLLSRNPTRPAPTCLGQSRFSPSSHGAL